jgi:hypothetical protein
MIKGALKLVLVCGAVLVTALYLSPWPSSGG